MRARLLAVRAGPLLILALVCGALLALSSLARLLPVQPAPALLFVWAAGGAAAALVPALLARGSPLPATLGVLVPVLAAASYGASRLDWLRTLKDFHVAEEGGPSFLRLGLGAAALLLAWALHALDTAFRLRWRSQERGILPGQARLAWRASLRRSGLVALWALGGAVLVALLVLLAVLAGPLVLPVERMAFLAPLGAAALLVAAALLLAGPPRQASADERQ